ncbi:MAG: class I SAM-dependent methyltransferase [Planctomycetota bacterium]
MKPADPQSLEHYFHLMSAEGAVEAYRTAVQLGILDALTTEPHSTAALADALALKPRPLTLLLELLRTLGLVTPAAEHASTAQVQPDTPLSLTPLGHAMLQGPYRDLGRPYWQHLPTLLQTGEPCAAMDQAPHNEAAYAQQAHALAWMLGPAAQTAAVHLEQAIHEQALPPDTDCRVLDAGAGAAPWSLALADRNPHPKLHLTALDQPAVLPAAQAAANARDLGDRFTAQPGDLRSLELTTPHYHLILLANVTHLLAPDACADLFRRLAPGLAPGGSLAIIDVFPADDATGPAASRAVLYEMGLALRTHQGQLHTLDTLTPALNNAGLTTPTLHPILQPPHTMSVLLSQRPA